MRELDAPALSTWRWDLSCTDDGEVVGAELIDRRLKPWVVNGYMRPRSSMERRI